MTNSSKVTPLMQQYNNIKNKYPDAILLFRVGDFYETFGADAVITAKILGITLTKRNNGAALHQELAGFPHHAIDNYVHKLVKAGYRVAICDQLEDPKLTKNIVKRGVTEIITPGVTTNEKILNHKQNNYLCALHLENSKAGIAFCDISTGEFNIAEGDWNYIEKLLQTIQAAEVIYAKNQRNFIKENCHDIGASFELDDWVFSHTTAKEKLLNHFETVTLKGYGIDEMTLATIAAGAVVHYLYATEHPHVQHITQVSRYTSDQHLWLDKNTIRNLELLQSIHTGGKSFFECIDYTLNPIGSRLLRKWLMFPLVDTEAILHRQEGVTWLISQPALKQELQENIKQICDFERLISKIPMCKHSPRELNHLHKALLHIAQIKSKIEAQNNSPILSQIVMAMHPLLPLQKKIENEIVSDAPVALQKGNVFKQGVIAELDELRLLQTDSKKLMLEIQQREQEATGIHSLKIGFNNVFGYYLEVTATHKNKVPESWIRKQTLANAERYITPELKKYEEKILGAEEKIAQLESKAWESFTMFLLPLIPQLQQTAQAIGQLDVLLSFAQMAITQNYTAPTFNNNGEYNLVQARHPVIELCMAKGEYYVPNDVHLHEDQQIIIITGPNMSGKSAILRQTALIVLLAQLGSYVPAQKANIAITDRLFTRVGASDNISSGESTFMVEMTETAGILNNLSKQSLLLLDEIGRGTSTYDGISIAWSLGEYLHEHAYLPKVLFATHYHELNELEYKCKRIKNYHVSTTEQNNKVIFLRKLSPGGSTHSFGIHVASMAGMPKNLVERANEILLLLEQKGMKKEFDKKLKEIPTQHFQLSLFDAEMNHWNEIQQMLQGVDLNTTTPVEALLKLNEIKKIIEKAKKN